MGKERAILISLFIIIQEYFKNFTYIFSKKNISWGDC